MDVVLKGMHWTEVFFYLDDIVIYSETLKENDKKARRLFNRLREAHLKLQPDKWEFSRTEVAYLGHIIGRHGVKPNPAKIAAIRKFLEVLLVLKKGGDVSAIREELDRAVGEKEEISALFSTRSLEIRDLDETV